MTRQPERGRLAGAHTHGRASRGDWAFERELLASAKAGDRRARQRLVELRMGLVRSVAYRYRDLGLPLDDLVQEGAIGLLDAVARFDSSRGASFATYARWCVRRATTSLSCPVRASELQILLCWQRKPACGRSPRARSNQGRTTFSWYWRTTAMGFGFVSAEGPLLAVRGRTTRLKTERGASLI